MSFTLYMHRYHGGLLLFTVSMLAVLVTGGCWFYDVIVESGIGQHTSYVTLGLRIGIILFIASEAALFLSFFWSYIHASINPNIGCGGVWPPFAITPISPWGLPLLNTVLLLTSGATVTLAHHAIISKDLNWSIIGMGLTLVLGAIFTGVQFSEYVESPFSMQDSVYGSLFFLITGFHGAHVIIGSLALLVFFLRLVFGMQHDSIFKVDSRNHVGLEGAIWYWHFVDVVWIFVYIVIYIWGGGFDLPGLSL